jgi:hypothetical protein
MASDVDSASFVDPHARVRGKSRVIVPVAVWFRKSPNEFLLKLAHVDSCELS